MSDVAQPSNDKTAEQSVLGAMLQSATAVNEITRLLSAEDFYTPSHARVYAAILAVIGSGEPVDAITVGAELERRGDFGRVGGAPYLLDLMQATPTPASAVYHAKIVAAKARLRRLGQLGEQLRSLSYSDATSVEDVEALLGQGERFFRQHHIADDRALSFDDLLASWEQWQAAPEGVIPTPWKALNDRLNGGLERGRLYTIGARPGVGKSVAALNIATNASYWGHKAVLFSLEMSGHEVMSRLLASGAEVDLGQIMRRDIDLETQHRLDTYTASNKGLGLQVVDRERITVEQVVAHCRSQGGVDLVCVDYLQLLTASDSRVSRQEQVAHMSRSLKIAARELDAAVVMCSQLNRGPLKDGKVRAPNIGDLRESGAVEQDSDVVLLLHSDEDDPGVVQMLVGKNRQGSMGSTVLSFDGRYARIT